MPYLKVQSSLKLTPEQSASLLQRLSALVAEQLGKPERYVMVVLEPPVPILFAGNDAPAVFMELKSIGLSESQTPALSSALCECLAQQLGINAERVYIEFADAPRCMWGWNGATF